MTPKQVALRCAEICDKEAERLYGIGFGNQAYTAEENVKDIRAFAATLPDEGEGYPGIAHDFEQAKLARDNAESKLAGLADTVASALRNTNMNDEGVTLQADLRDFVWSLSYEANAQRERATRAEAKLAECEKDAARYRWMRTSPGGMKRDWLYMPHTEELDAAIDAAQEAK